MSFDSQHYYTRDGAPAHYQGDRPTTLRDARAQNLVPSVSTVLSIIAKPQLERWKRRQSVLAALTLGRMPGEHDNAYLARIDSDAHRQVHEAAAEGTAIHDAIEASYRATAFPARYRPHVDAVRRMLSDNFNGVTDWVVEKSFSHRLGFGGRVDLHSPSTGIVLDHKGKDLAPDDDRQLAYDQHWQLGGYAIGLDLPESTGGNLFISRTHPGHVVFHEWTEAKMRTGRVVFMDTLMLWKSLKQFDGAW